MKIINLATSYAGNVEQSSFTAEYHKTFKLFHCTTEVLKDQTYRMRNSIYCREHGHEDPCPKGDGYIERDEYDARAEHFLLRHKISNEMVGSLRVILPNEENPGDSFPMQKLSDHGFLQDGLNTLKLCEISRFCMAPRFRKRGSDGKFLSSYHVPENTGAGFVRRKISYPQAALLQGAFEAAMKAGILDCLWMVEFKHLPSLKALGFECQRLGGELDIHGGMQPVIFNIKHVLDSIRQKAPACWDVISDEGRLQDTADELSMNQWRERMSQPAPSVNQEEKISEEVAG